MKSKIPGRIKESFAEIKAKPRLLAACALADAVFIIVYALFSSSIYEKMLEYTFASSSLIARGSSELGQRVASSSTISQAFVSTGGAKPFVYDSIILAAILVIGTYLIYSVFQGLSWYMSGKIAGKEPGYRRFMKAFFRINLIWIGIYYLADLIGIVIGFRNRIAGRPYAGNITDLGILVPVILAILVYFSLVSYGMLFSGRGKEWRRSIKSGFMKAREIVPAILMAAAVVAIAHIIQLLLFKLNVVIGGIAFFAVELPAFTLARVMIIHSMEGIR